MRQIPAIHVNETPIKSLCSKQDYTARNGQDALVTLTVGKSHLGMVQKIMLHVRDVQLESGTNMHRGRVDFMCYTGTWRRAERRGCKRTRVVVG